jgi:hypothetical protein
MGLPYGNGGEPKRDKLNQTEWSFHGWMKPTYESCLLTGKHADPLPFNNSDPATADTTTGNVDSCSKHIPGFTYLFLQDNKGRGS